MSLFILRQTFLCTNRQIRHLSISTKWLQQEKQKDLMSNESGGQLQTSFAKKGKIIDAYQNHVTC